MAGLQVDVYVSIGITWFAALIALCMRMTARQITHIKWWFDDCFSVLAIVSFPLIIFRSDLLLMRTVHKALCDWVLRYLDRM